MLHEGLQVAWSLLESRNACMQRPHRPTYTHA